MESIEISVAQAVTIGRELAGMQGQPVETVRIEARSVADSVGIPPEAVVVVDVDEESDLFYVLPEGRAGDVP